MGISLVGGWMSEAGVEGRLWTTKYKPESELNACAGPWPMVLSVGLLECWIRM
ncbi:hypothetical protein B0T20DRAFT_415992 [Sordaria brevicollis]|uniref:Uncharacterized protein n=1 Tax=Sordaria brevicollis TaxID=83679 RepID=A0AAE0PCD1_SORBR|nr:hypothetical protein B0T20DRAFT_415992 [Sordaria brevicollis]